MLMYRVISPIQKIKLITNPAIQTFFDDSSSFLPKAWDSPTETPVLATRVMAWAIQTKKEQAPTAATASVESRPNHIKSTRE